jgi:parvulin-like peptidyl-prolyl isomerase
MMGHAGIYTQTLRRLFLILLGFGLLTLPLAAVVVERIVIKVNDEIITQYEIDQRDQEMRKEYASAGKAIPYNFRQQVTDQLINEKLVDELTKKEGIFVTQIEVEAEINSFVKERGMDLNALKDGLRRDGTTYEAFYEQMRKQILMNKLFSKGAIVSAASVNPSEQEIQDFYQKHAPDEFHLMWLYISLPPGATFAQRNAAEPKIKNVETALAQNPWSFATVAAANADRWRDYGFVLPDPDLPKYLIPAFSRLQWNGQVFSFRVVDEIPGFAGFHALLLVNKRRVALDKVRDLLESAVRREKRAEAVNTWLAGLRKDASVIYMP